ncbi:hypothetical protein B7463_g10945, partial [Scytalidium lignicola]
MQEQQAGQPLEIRVRSSETSSLEPVACQDVTHDQISPEPKVSRAAEDRDYGAITSLSENQGMHEGLITPAKCDERLPAFQFINERDLHEPENVNLRRAMRAHVRRDMTLKRQRNNAIYMSRFSGSRKILKKSPPYPNHSLSHKKEGVVLRRTRSSRSVPVHVFRVASAPKPIVSVSHTSTGLDIHPDHTKEIDIPMQSKYTPNVAVTTTIFLSLVDILTPTYHSATPYALQMGPSAPTLYMQPHRWPFMHSIQGARPAISVYMPTSTIPIPNIRSKRPCLLKSARINMWIVNSVDYFIFKDNLIKWVNERLDDPRKGTDETTIGGILLLTSLELCRGNSTELEAHIDGLKRIASIRGGLDKMTDMNHFRLKVQLNQQDSLSTRIDLLVAAMLDTETRFPTPGLGRPLRPPPRLHGLIQIPDSPLYGHQFLQDILLDSPFCAQSIVLLQQMQDLTRGFLLQGTPSHPIPLLPSEPTASLLQVCNVDQPPSLLNIITLTATLYTQFFSNTTLPVSISTLTTALTTCLESTVHDETWMQYPGILLWIVLTGCAATTGEKGERSFFLLWATRIGLSSVWGWWEEMRMSVEGFSRVRRGGRCRVG